MTKPRYTHNSVDTVYYQAAPTSLRFAFLVVSEYFDTPSDGVAERLQLVCEALNEGDQRT